MSLSDAPRSVGNNPPKNSVAAPTVKADQDRDIDRKLRLYGVIQAFRNGCMPSNKQIDEILSYLHDMQFPAEAVQLSPEGRRLVDDLRNVVETIRLLINEKNTDEVFQRFIYRTSGVQYENLMPAVGTPISEKEARQDAREALGHMRTLFRLLATNSETRKLFSDAKLIGRNIFSDAAYAVADRVRPRQEELEQVDEAILRSKFHNGFADDSDIAVTDSSMAEAPDLVPRHTTPNEKVPSETAIEASESEDGKVVPKRTFKSRLKSLTARVTERRIPCERDTFEDGKKYLQNQFPKERREQFAYRLKKVILECQADSSYQSSLSWFLSQLEAYFGHGQHYASAGSNQKASFLADPMIAQALSEIRTFVEHCANYQSMEGMFSAARNIWEDSQNDEELRAWWNRVDKFARRSLLEPGFILSPAFESQTRRLRVESRRFFEVKYKEHFDALVDSIQTWFRAFSEDPLNQRLWTDSSQLIEDLLLDSQGKFKYKPHLWTDIQMILPMLVKWLGYVPVPRIEYTNDVVDVVIENLTLQGRNLFPKIVEVQAQNYVKFSPYRVIRNEHHHTVKVVLSQIQTDMHDVAFFYRKKRGLHISDTGLADILIGGKGISIKVKIVSNESDSVSLFKVKGVSVKVNTLKFAIRDSKHPLLYRTFRPFVISFIKKQIAKAISSAIFKGLEYTDGQLVEMRERLAAVGTGSKTDVLKDMWADRKSELSKKISHSGRSGRQSRFRLFAKRDSMLFPEQGHERGLIRKQAERDAAVIDGEGWKSAAFSIIHADG
ncbi:hypothetical protein EW145_g940 [Phellinidium pouzarii]|uniref:Uncharacterized protein n=1 Tax=Phellinidium pouzarii TaxID=167371 RepID=A0A4S4LGE8_9AGAM|nr:hypothetical protein EW145_g940 [Phellinidium pouzarii]